MAPIFKDQRCSRDFCWVAPQTGDNPIHSIFGVGGDVWAVGGAGSALRRHEGKWSVVDTATLVDLRGVWGSGPDDVWLVGDHGTTLHWDGMQLSAIASGVDRTLHGVWGSGKDNVYAVGAEKTILRWDGGAWTVVQETPGSYETLRAISGSAPDHILVAGYSRYPGGAICAGDSEVLRFDGSTWWSESGIDVSCSMLLALDTTGPDSWLASDHAIYHRNKAGWSLVSIVDDNGDDDGILMDLKIIGDEVWVVTDYGLIRRSRYDLDVSNSTIEPSDDEACLGRGQIEGAMIGDLQGRIFHIDAGATVDDVGTRKHRSGYLLASPTRYYEYEYVSGSQGSSVVVHEGGQGKVLLDAAQFNGEPPAVLDDGSLVAAKDTTGSALLVWDGSWTEIPTSEGSAVPFNVSGTSPKDLWLTSGTTASHWNGWKWTEVGLPASVDLQLAASPGASWLVVHNVPDVPGFVLVRAMEAGVESLPMPDHFAPLDGALDGGSLWIGGVRWREEPNPSGGTLLKYEAALLRLQGSSIEEVPIAGPEPLAMSDDQGLKVGAGNGQVVVVINEQDGLLPAPWMSSPWISAFRFDGQGWSSLEVPATYVDRVRVLDSQVWLQSSRGLLRSAM